MSACIRHGSSVDETGRIAAQGSTFPLIGIRPLGAILELDAGWTVDA
ncbi:MAG: hypothetical protein ABI277_00200 [Burkholderiaceae bacterium]